MFIVKNCSGDPVLGEVCASKAWPFSSACANLRAASTRGRNMVFQTSSLEWVQTHISNFVVSGPKFTGLFSLNAAGMAVEC